MTDMTVANGFGSDQGELIAELARLRAENAKLKTRGLHLKVSEKGGVSLYGMGKFPVTLYREQWERLIAHIDEVKAFIQEHSSELSSKK